MSPDDYISVPLGDGLIVARRDSGRLFIIAGSARFVWERRAEGVPDTKIPRLLATHYGISLARAEQDVRDVLELWISEGLIIAGGICREYTIADQWFAIHYQNEELEAALAPTLENLTPIGKVGFKGYRREFDLRVKDGSFVLRIDYGEGASGTLLLDEVVERLLTDILQFAYDKFDWIFSLHAAAIATESACVLIPGPSGSGKSTLAAALVSQGYSYLTDDLVLLDRADMQAVPLPTPLVLKSSSWEPLESFVPALSSVPIRRRFNEDIRYWSPGEGQVTRIPLPVRTILFPAYRQGAAVEITEVSAFEALNRIVIGSSVVAAPISPQTVDRLVSWVRQTPAYAVTYGSLSTALAAVRQHLEP